METIKSHTDLEQSKKLAEILPIESADMHYNNGSCRGVDYTEHFSAELMPYQEALYLMKIHKTNFMFQVIPCWSLSALLDIIPKKYYPIKGHETELIISKPKGKWFVLYWDDTGMQDGEQTLGYNLVDACVTMIEKLHEQNLL